MTEVTTDFAISYLLDDCEDCPENKDGECMTQSQCFEVKQMAIKALRQECVEPTQKHVGNALDMRCDDLISRQALDEIKELMTDINGNTVYAVRMSDIRHLPSVNPQEPKTGHWILADSQDNVDVENGNNRYICSECTFSDIHAKSTEVSYCWHCGARMESEI